jgi:hypothetical protein
MNFQRCLLQVKRYSYTTSNESATSGQQLWSLERNCSGKCEDGCIVIGERIKIYACQACCETPLCNISNGSSGRSAVPPFVCLASIILFLLLRATVVSGGSSSRSCPAFLCPSSTCTTGPAADSDPDHSPVRLPVNHKSAVPAT